MKHLIVLVFLTYINFFEFLYSQKAEIPEGYLLQYKQDFQKDNSLNDFICFSENNQYRLVSEKGLKFLRVINADTVSYKSSLLVLDNYIFGDFLYEFKYRTRNLSINTIPELSIIFSFKDTLNYYSLCLIPKNKDSLTIKLTANDRGKTAIKFESIVSIKLKEWNEIIVTRELIDRVIRIYVNNRNKPLISINDWSLVMGHLGIAIKSGILDVDDINIWSQTFIDNKLKK